MRACSSHHFTFKSIIALGAAVLLLLAGALATGYQYHSAHAEHRRQLTVQARVLAASVTAAIAFNDRVTAEAPMPTIIGAVFDAALPALAIVEPSLPA